MRLAIVGCGTISHTYIQALAALGDSFEITALYDIHPEKAIALKLPGAVLCKDMDALISRADVDCVIISTPLHTHTRLAEQCLQGKKHVLMEKPAALSVEEIDHLFALAAQMGVVFHVAFHASMGVDIDWYLQQFGNTDSPFSPNNIRRLECGFFDPYLTDGVMDADKKALGGSYIDSGVNILSVCHRLMPATELVLRSHNDKQTADGVVYRSETVYGNQQTTLVMRTGWDLGLNRKRTLLHFHGTDQQILLDHTGQAVWQIVAGEKNLLFREETGSRMVNQYIRVFSTFADALRMGSDAAHRQRVMQIHQLLLRQQTAL